MQWAAATGQLVSLRHWTHPSVESQRRPIPQPAPQSAPTPPPPPPVVLVELPPQATTTAAAAKRKADALRAARVTSPLCHVM
jgi:hypothetical protein